MPYCLLPDDGPLEESLRRIAGEQLDRALASIDATDEDLHDRVHDARKRCKKVRGLLRLVRPALPDYRRENAALRDAARRLAALRDRTAYLETLDELRSPGGASVPEETLRPLREALECRRREAVRDADLPARLAAFRDDLAACRARSTDWRLDDEGPDVLKAGLVRTLKRARRGMAQARDTRRPHDLHEWRKRVKYHWYHARLLRRAWPRMMAAHVDAADDLGKRLGAHHDLSEFSAVLQDPSLPMSPRAALSDTVRGEMERLEAEVFPLGRRLLAEKPKRVANRWLAWRAVDQAS